MDRTRVIALTLALIAAIAVPICASTGWARGLGVLGLGGGAAAPSGDVCTGNLLYSHHAENADDATANANGTQGCSASEAYKSWVKTSAVYDNTAGYFGDGAYALKSNGYNHRATITTTGWIDLTEKGSISMWFRGNSANDSTIFSIDIDSTHYIRGLYYYATGYVRITINDGSGAVSHTTTAGIPASGGWLQFGWDATTDLLQARVCDDAACSGESWETKTTLAFADIGTMPAAMDINGVSGQSARGWADNVKIYSSSNCQ